MAEKFRGVLPHLIGGCQGNGKEVSRYQRGSLYSFSFFHDVLKLLRADHSSGQKLSDETLT